MEEAQRQTLANGVDVIRRHLESDEQRRQEFHSTTNLVDPIDSFSPADRAIINGPPPPYTDADRLNDEEYINLMCPIKQTVPDPSNMVKWRGKIYSRTGLEWLRGNAIEEPSDGWKNPLTRSPLNRAQFHQQDTFLNTQERHDVTTIIINYATRTQRRESHQNYIRLRNQFTSLQNVSHGQTLTQALVQISGRSTVASPIDEHINRRLREDHDGVVLAGMNYRRRTPQSPLQVQLDNLFEGSVRRRSGDSSSDESSAEVVQQAIVQSQRGNNRRGRGSRQGNTSRRHNVTSQQSRQITVQQPVLPSLPNNNNPLREQRLEKIAFPQQLWGDPIVETAVKEFYLLCESEGFETNLHRRKTAFLLERTSSLFEENGPFVQYRPISHQVLGTRLSRLDRHFNSLVTNHSNDPTGAVGEDVPLWFGVVQRFKQFVESSSVRGRAQATRSNLREVQVTLGAVQPPLGHGIQPLRSEIAAENPPQVPGELSLGVGMQINNVSDNQVSTSENPLPSDEAATGTAQGRRRRRVSTGVSRRNRPRNSRTIQDDIDEGREQLGQLAESLSRMTEAVVTPSATAVASVNPLASDPVSNLRTITESVTMLAASLPADQQAAYNGRLMGSWMGILNNFDVENGVNQDNNNNNVESESNETSSLTNN